MSTSDAPTSDASSTQALGVEAASGELPGGCVATGDACCDTSPAEFVTEEAGNTFLVDPRVRQLFGDNCTQHPSQARTVPSGDGNLLWTSVDADELWRHLGLRNGDRLHNVNDAPTPMRTPEQFYHQLEEEGELSLSVMRRGQMTTVRMVMRPPPAE